MSKVPETFKENKLFIFDIKIRFKNFFSSLENFENECSVSDL